MYEIIKQKTISHYYFSYTAIRKIYMNLFISKRNEWFEGFTDGWKLNFYVTYKIFQKKTTS